MPADARDAPGRFGRGIQPLDAAVASLLRDARGEGERRRRRATSRSPRHPSGASVDLHRLPASGGHHVDLRLVPSSSPREEGDARAVRRQLGRGVGRAPGEPARTCRRADRHATAGPRRGWRRGRGATSRRPRTSASGAISRAADRDELLDVVGAHAHSPANELVSPIRRVLSSGIGSTAARATSAANSRDVVELAGGLAPRGDRAGVGPLEQRRGDRALDHVARDDDEADAALFESRDALAQGVLAGALGQRDRHVLGHRRRRADEVGLVTGDEHDAGRRRRAAAAPSRAR